jgi:hypothetical protein
MRRVLGLGFACLLSVGCSASTVRSEEALCEPSSAAHPVLVAQAVPSATLLPCIRVFPAGWGYGGSEVMSGRSRFWLDSDRAGIHAVEVELTEGCHVGGLRDVTSASGELDVRVYLRPISLSPYAADRYFVFEGGCITYRYRFAEAEEAPNLAAEADDALTFMGRDVLVDLVDDSYGLTLCGAEAPPCVGED